MRIGSVIALFLVVFAVLCAVAWIWWRIYLACGWFVFLKGVEWFWLFGLCHK